MSLGCKAQGKDAALQPRVSATGKRLFHPLSPALHQLKGLKSSRLAQPSGFSEDLRRLLWPLCSSALGTWNRTVRAASSRSFTRGSCILLPTRTAPQLQQPQLLVLEAGGMCFTSTTPISQLRLRFLQRSRAALVLTGASREQEQLRAALLG